MGHINTSLNLSVEQTPKKILGGNVSEYVVNNVDYITIPHLNQNTLKTAYKSASQLSDVYGVNPSRVIPHIAARSIQSKKELTEAVNNFKDLGIERLLIVGGNPSQPKGPYRDAYAVRQRVAELYNFRTHCGVYPDTESASGVYLYKYVRFESGFTQLSLSPRRLEKFKINTRIGIPSKANWDGLYRYMKLCGVGPSLRYPFRNIVGFARFMTFDGFNTTKLVKTIQPHATFHVYDFGRIEETVEELLVLDV
jgi:methylenetetrahydrofolate reductase (NADPH)